MATFFYVEIKLETFVKPCLCCRLMTFYEINILLPSKQKRIENDCRKSNRLDPINRNKKFTQTQTKQIFIYFYIFISVIIIFRSFSHNHNYIFFFLIKNKFNGIIFYM